MLRNAEGQPTTAEKSAAAARQRHRGENCGDGQKYGTSSKKKKKQTNAFSHLSNLFCKQLLPKDQFPSPQWTADSLVLRTPTALLGRSHYGTPKQTSRHKTIHTKGAAEARNKWYNAWHASVTPYEMEL